jgi:quercetin dioxygenase-like cupin family protein
MRKLFIVALSVIAVSALAGVAQESKPHILLPAARVKWGPAPPSVPKGVQLAVVSGNPAAAGPFVIRLKIPAGQKIAPHWHPTDEHVTVISGTVAFGMGEKFDQAALKNLSAGGFALMPAEMRHFAMAKTAVILQVHGTGPFVLNYVNPSDDPSKVNAATR